MLYLLLKLIWTPPTQDFMFSGYMYSPSTLWNIFMHLSATRFLHLTVFSKFMHGTRVDFLFFFLFQKLCNEYTMIHLFILWLMNIYAVFSVLPLKQCTSLCVISCSLSYIYKSGPAGSHGFSARVTMRIKRHCDKVKAVDVLSYGHWGAEETQQE